MPEAGLSEPQLQKHIALYRFLIESNKPFPVSQLYQTYIEARPLLHRQLASELIDFSAFNYSLSRLPIEVTSASHIYLLSNYNSLNSFGYDPNNFRQVNSHSRRRLIYHQYQSNSLYFLISSESDYDDIINCLIAFTIEWNKLGKLIRSNPNSLSQDDDQPLLGFSHHTWRLFKKLLGQNWLEILKANLEPIDPQIENILGAKDDFQQSANDWWLSTSRSALVLDFDKSPLYFVSSNTHSLVNLIGGHVNTIQNQIFSHIDSRYPHLSQAWQELKKQSTHIRTNDFLYYISSLYFADNPDQLDLKISFETSLGIHQIKPPNQLLSCPAQIIPVSAISRSKLLDPALKIQNPARLSQSQAMIINIDYPLGQAAYHLLLSVVNSQKNIKGVYVMGKAAILNGEIGDIQVPNLVFDEITGNTYRFENHFNGLASSVLPKTSLFNLKSVTVYGPFLENQPQIDNYLQNDFNIIEMETAHYLKAVYENHFKTSAPHHFTADLNYLAYDLGVINYASDNPLSKTLGEGAMALSGIQPTYAASLAIIQRIIDIESAI